MPVAKTKSTEEAKKEVSQFIAKWRGKSQLMDSFARDANGLIIDLGVIEDEVRAQRKAKVALEEQIAALKSEVQERLDSSQQQIDNHHAKLTEERVKVAAMKREVEAQRQELKNKLMELDRKIIAKNSK